MKIIEPSIELWTQSDDWEKHVVKCARVCYGKKNDDNADKTIKSLLARKHHSMFRHRSVYYIIPSTIFEGIGLLNSPYADYRLCGQKYYVTTNGNFLIDNKDYLQYCSKYEVSPEEFSNTECGFSMMRYTFKVITQISTSRELNRVSPNNISERSTRYVYEDGTLCKPHWMSVDEMNVFNNEIIIPDKYFHNDILREYCWSCDNSFQSYHRLVDLGMSRQDARGTLPLDTATTCIYTYSIAEWKHIIDLRYHGITGKPHPNAKIIAGMIRNKLNELGHNV